MRGTRNTLILSKSENKENVKRANPPTAEGGAGSAGDKKRPDPEHEWEQGDVARASKAPSPTDPREHAEYYRQQRVFFSLSDWTC